MESTLLALTSQLLSPIQDLTGKHGFVLICWSVLEMERLINPID